MISFQLFDLLRKKIRKEELLQRRVAEEDFGWSVSGMLAVKIGEPFGFDRNKLWEVFYMFRDVR